MKDIMKSIPKTWRGKGKEGNLESPVPCSKMPKMWIELQFHLSLFYKNKIKASPSGRVCTLEMSTAPTLDTKQRGCKEMLWNKIMCTIQWPNQILCRILPLTMVLQHEFVFLILFLKSFSSLQERWACTGYMNTN